MGTLWWSTRPPVAPLPAQLTQKAPLFSFSWDGTLLGELPTDLWPIISGYWTYSCHSRSELRPEKYTDDGKQFLNMYTENFPTPFGIAINKSGEIFIASRRRPITWECEIQIFSKTHEFQRYFTLEFHSGPQDTPFGVAFDLENDMVVVNPNFSGIEVYDPIAGKRTRDIRTKAPRQKIQPWGIAVDVQGNYVITDWVGQTIQVFSPKGSWLREIGVGKLERPSGICVDPNTGNYVVADRQNHRLVVFSPTGDKIRVIGKAGHGEGEFYSPTALFIDRNGTIIVGKQGSTMIQFFTSDGTYLSYGTPYPAEGPLRGIAIDPDGGVVCCYSHVYPGQRADARVVRYLPQATLA